MTETDPYNKLWGAGQWDDSSNNGIGTYRGTSFSSPQVAGAFAVLRQKWPNKSVNELTALLQQTGVRVKDTRTNNVGIITPRMVVGEAIKDRDTRPVFDYTKDGLTDFPVLAADSNKTIVLSTINADGSYTAGSNVGGGWAGRKLLTPVHDFLQNGTNGFLMSEGDNLVYRNYQADTKTLSAPTTVLSGLSSTIESLGEIHGLKRPGTGKGVIYQKANGSVVIRTINPESTTLGAESTVFTSTTHQLIGAADLTGDGIQDVVMRNRITGEPFLKKGADTPTTNVFPGAMTSMSTDANIKAGKQLFVFEEFAGITPRLGYLDPVGNLTFVHKLNSDGTASPVRQSVVDWVPGVRILPSTQWP